MTATMGVPVNTLDDVVKADAADAAKLARATVVLELSIRAPSFRRKLDSENIVQDGTDTEFIHVSKDLIDPEALKQINRAASQFKNRTIKFRSVPCSMLGGGRYLIPLTLVNETDGKIVDFRSDRMALVDKYIITPFDELKSKAEQRLGTHYRESDYPSPQELRNAFDVQYKFTTFNVPAALEQLNKELFEREKQRVEAQWTEAYTEIRGALRESLAGLVDHLVDRLEPESDGKPKRLYDTTVTQLQDFLETFQARNLTNDDQLAALAAKAQRLIKGVRTDQLKEPDSNVRARIREGFAQVKTTLDTMVTTKRRAIQLDD